MVLSCFAVVVAAAIVAADTIAASLDVAHMKT